MKKSKDKVKKPEPAKTETTTRGEVYDWMQSLVFALIICILVFVFLFRIVDVSGDSMNPTLTNGGVHHRAHPHWHRHPGNAGKQHGKGRYRHFPQG